MPNIVIVLCAIYAAIVGVLTTAGGIFLIADKKLRLHAYLLTVLLNCAMLVLAGRAFRWW